MKHNAPLMRHLRRFALSLSIFATAFATQSVRAERFGPINATAIPIYESHGYTTMAGYTAGLVRLKNEDKTNPHYIRIGAPLHSEGYSREAVLSSNSRRLELAPDQTADIWIYRPAISLYNNAVTIEVDGDSRDLYNSIWVGDHESPNRDEYHYRSHGHNYSPLSVLFSQKVSNQDKGEIEDKIHNMTEYSPVLVRSALNSKAWPTSWLAHSQFEMIMMTELEYDEMTPAGKAAISDYIASGGCFWIIPEDKKDAENNRGARNRVLQVPDKYKPLSEIIGFGEFRYSYLSDPSISMSSHRDVISRVASRVKSRNLCKSPNRANDEMPVVDKTTVPVRTILVLLIGYAILIGPALQFFLMKKRRRIWMLWLVPAASIGICVTVLIWSLFSEGIYGHMQMQLVTVIDQPAGRASTLGWAGYYSPLTDSDGLRFSSDTMLQPQLAFDYRMGRESRSLAIDWTSGQHLTTGWLLSREPIHFRLQKVEQRREKLIFRRTDNDAIEVTNALSAEVTDLYVRFDDNRCHKIVRIGAGETVTLNTDVVLPTNYRSSALLDIYLNSSQELPNVNHISRQYLTLLGPMMYVAKVEGHPFVNAGMTNPSTNSSATVVIGRFEEER